MNERANFSFNNFKAQNILLKLSVTSTSLKSNFTSVPIEIVIKHFNMYIGLELAVGKIE